MRHHFRGGTAEFYFFGGKLFVLGIVVASGPGKVTRPPFLVLMRPGAKILASKKTKTKTKKKMRVLDRYRACREHRNL
jgi:hypothetical protein